MPEEREGKPIYREGKVEVRTFDRDEDSHNVWVGENYFLFMRGCLEQLAIRTPTEYLYPAFANYNFMIPPAVRKAGITLEKFADILRIAREKEREEADKEFEKFKRENRL